MHLSWPQRMLAKAVAAPWWLRPHTVVCVCLIRSGSQLIVHVNAATVPLRQHQHQQKQQHEYSRELKLLLGTAGLRTAYDMSSDWTALHHAVLASAASRVCNVRVSLLRCSPAPPTTKCLFDCRMRV